MFFFPQSLSYRGSCFKSGDVVGVGSRPGGANHVEVAGISPRWFGVHGMSVRICCAGAIGETVARVIGGLTMGPAKGSPSCRGSSNLVVVWPVESTCTTWIYTHANYEYPGGTHGYVNKWMFSTAPITQPMVRRSSCQHWRAIGQVLAKKRDTQTQVRSLCIGRSSIPKWKKQRFFIMGRGRIERETSIDVQRAQKCQTLEALFGAGHKKLLNSMKLDLEPRGLKDVSRGGCFLMVGLSSFTMIGTFGQLFGGTSDM